MLGADHTLPGLRSCGIAYTLTTKLDGTHLRLPDDPAATAIDQVSESPPRPGEVAQIPGDCPDGHACKGAPSVEAVRACFDSIPSSRSG
ncbi:hypothetical protein [Streptomyces malaysiensis]|uniref:hypothetical protein n=1 Tax=Streptomyces malaysiensis TaxID=92644 RepID=UPI0032201C91|nr:hypothetical protein [Streptomyces malaysiensis]